MAPPAALNWPTQEQPDDWANRGQPHAHVTKHLGQLTTTSKASRNMVWSDYGANRKSESAHRFAIINHVKLSVCMAISAEQHIRILTIWCEVRPHIYS